MPNTRAASAVPWGRYRTSVKALEANTWLNLLYALPAELQNQLEVGVDAGPTE